MGNRRLPDDRGIERTVNHDPKRHARITVTRVGCGTSGQIDPSEVRQAMTSQTRLVAMLHVSNVTGAVQPVQEVGQIAREAEAFYLIDVAQSLGHIPIQVADCQADLVAGSGHKGLMGPLGLGVQAEAWQRGPS